MNKNTKLWLIAAASLILIGIVIFGGVMSMLKWDFTKLSTNKYETNEYKINENYNSISIVSNTADIVINPSEASESSVVCYELKNMKHSVTVKDSTLVIEVVDSRKWYEHISIGFDTPKITVYIPQGEYTSLSISSDTGDVEIPDAFKFESIDISTSTGDIKNYASTSKAIKIKTSTGDIHVEKVSAGALDLSVSTGDVIAKSITCDGDVKIKVSTGITKLFDVTCKNVISSGSTGDIYLKNVIASEKFSIERDTGYVKLERCDAYEIFIETDTGDVTGTLLSEKVFIPRTDTGSVKVPQTVTGGRCEITTDTGNIRIDIVSN